MVVLIISGVESSHFLLLGGGGGGHQIRNPRTRGYQDPSFLISNHLLGLQPGRDREVRENINIRKSCYSSCRKIQLARVIGIYYSRQIIIQHRGHVCLNKMEKF